MVLSKKYLKRLISKGKAKYSHGTEQSSTYRNGINRYVAVDRIDKQRVDHYEL